MPVVEVPGTKFFEGFDVEFPDGMSHDEMASHIVNHLNERTLSTSPYEMAAKRTRESVRPEAGRQMGGATGFGEEAATGLPIIGAAADETPEAAKLREERPWTAAGARLTGGAIGAAPFFAAAPGYLGAMAVGGGLGAADRAARGGSWGDVGTSAALGAAGGAAGQFIGGLVGKGIGAVANWLTKPGGILAGYSTKSVETAAQAAKASGLTEDQIAYKAAFLGPEGFLAEYAPQFEGLAGGIASRPGAGQDIVRNAVTARAPGAGERIEGAVNEAMGPSVNIAETNAARAAQRSAAATPLYQQFRNTAIPMTPELESLISPLKESGALGSAYKKMSIQNKPAADTYFKMENGEPTLNTTTAPKAETWDYAKRALDDKISAAARTGLNDDVRIFTELKNKLTSAIDNHPNPNVAGVWKSARQAYAEPTAIQNAQEAGQELLKRSTRADEFAREFTGLSVPEKEAMTQGARDAIKQIMESSSRGNSEAINLIRSPHAQQKLSTMIGPEKTQRLVQAMEREHTFGASHSTIVRNSETARRQAFASELEPSAEPTMIEKVARFYNPEVAPAGFLELTGIPKMAREARATEYTDVVRPDLARMMTSRGQQAQDIFNALKNHKPAPGKAIKANTRNAARSALGGGAVGIMQPPPSDRRKALQRALGGR